MPSWNKPAISAQALTLDSTNGPRAPSSPGRRGCSESLQLSPAVLLAVEDRSTKVHCEADAEHEGEVALFLRGDDLACAEFAGLAVERFRAALDDLVGGGDAVAAVRHLGRQAGPLALFFAVLVVVH